MERRLLQGLSWLGEAAGDDATSMRFVRVAIALEALVADDGGPSTQMMHAGITAPLRERAAFLASDEPEERMEVHRLVGSYYGRRSSVVHGGVVEIDPAEVDAFGSIVWRVARGLIRNLDALSAPSELGRWIKERRYS